SGLLKFQGKRFSTICSEMYQDFFFHELHETGIYWNFLGFCQLLTAFLLFTQRYTTLAALLFTGICTNIFIFTLSANMIDKVVIMSFMMLVAMLLICGILINFLYYLKITITILIKYKIPSSLLYSCSL